MTDWFLHLFARVRWQDVTIANLQEAAAEARSEATALRQALDDARRDRENVWELVKAALSAERTAVANERAAYQMHVNHAVQRQGGGVPYPEAHSLPPEATPKLDAETGPAGRMSRILPSEVYAQAAKSFIAADIARRQSKQQKAG